LKLPLGLKNGKAVFIAHGCAAVVGTAEAGDNGAICQRITLDAVGRHGGKRRSSLGGFETLFSRGTAQFLRTSWTAPKAKRRIAGASEARLQSCVQAP